MEAGNLSPEPWPAPAKLNRFLHIVGRRADGYHLLQTIFQFLDLCDYLIFTPRQDDRVERSGGPPGVPAAQDLTVRAARLLQQVGGVRQGVSIHLDKRLPLGGGLGGGSSDAATPLVALNHYWDVQLPPQQLAALALQLGADVPVFVTGLAAWGEGVGERLTPVTPDEPWFLVLQPPCTVATATIFNDSELTRDSQARKIAGFVADDMDNDCAAVVFKRYPVIAEMAAWLSRFARVRLTGTGACIFAAFNERCAAEQIYAELPQGWQGFVSRGCNRSLLLERLEREKIANPEAISDYWAVAKR